MLKRLLSAQLKVWHLLLAIVLLVVGTGTSFGQTATPTSALERTGRPFSAGEFRMAAASEPEASMYVKSTDGEKEVLRVPFSVPAGQKADIAAFFNAKAYKYPNGYCYLTFYLDTIGSTALLPGEIWVADGYVHSGAYPTFTGQGYLGDVAAGKHVVIATIKATGGDCYVNDRSIILISNRRG